MTAVNSLGPAQLQSWMVARLFNTQDQTATSKLSASTPAVSTSASKLSGTTLSAMTLLGDSSALPPDTRDSSWKIITLSYSTSTNQISGLTDDMVKDFSDYVTGPDLPPLAPGMPPQQKQIGLVGRMLQMKAINNMTSQQISDAFYGNGLPVNDPKYGSFVNGPNLTFASVIADGADTVAGLRRNAATQDMSDAERQDVLADADAYEQQTKAMQEAYNNHTLTFMKVADIPDANYSATMTYSNNNTVNDVGVDEIYNQSAVDAYTSQHPNSIFNNYGGVSMIWSW